MRAQTVEFLPRCSAVGRTEKRSVFDARVDGVGIGIRRFKVPNAFEFPRMGRTVVPLVRSWNAVVDELVIHRFPRFAAVVGSLDHLAEPTARLRRVEPIGVGGRAFKVVNLPAAEMRAFDRPSFAVGVRREDKSAFARADQNSYEAHWKRLPERRWKRLERVKRLRENDERS